MNFLYLLPFSYFLVTRLRVNSVAFHVVFEWVAAVVLVVVLSDAPPLSSVAAAGISYLAFISIYELGYLINDLISSRTELEGRRRGPQGASNYWLAAWFGSRLVCFSLITLLWGKLEVPEWWSFYAALGVVFALHNVLADKELKTITFLWLAWIRFMAPVIFVVEGVQVPGIGAAAAMAYVFFRLFGYMDSKGLLRMPGRQRKRFRLFVFVMPLIGMLVLWPYDFVEGYLVLSGYFVVAAASGTLLTALLARSTSKQG